jgi:hypothetical protein
MNDVDPRTELFREGLKTYLDVKQAVKAFEDLIEEIAKRVVSAHLDELKPIIVLREQGIFNGVFDPEPSRVAVGALVVAQGAGIRCGIRWGPSEGGKPGGSMACVSVRPHAPRARATQNNLYRALALHHQDSTGVRVEIAPPGQWEVHVAVPLQSDITPDQLEEGLDTAFTTFLNLATKAGGLQAAIDGAATMP